MSKKELTEFITSWNVRYPYDKEWRAKHKIPLFSLEHRRMCLVDIYMEKVEDDLYKEARENYLEEKRRAEEGSITSLRDKDYILGQGNWLTASEDNMSEKEIDAIFDKIKF